MCIIGSHERKTLNNYPLDPQLISSPVVVQAIEPDLNQVIMVVNAGRSFNV